MQNANETAKKSFFRFFVVSLGGTFVMSLYVIVDSVCIGQYHGEQGSAALAIVMPLWTLIFSLGLLFGVGGSVLYSNMLGKQKLNSAKEYFTLTLFTAVSVGIIVTILVYIFEKSLISFFGGKDVEVVNLAKAYLFWIKIAIVFAIFNQTLICFVRSDNAPKTVTLSVITGGAFNAALDVLLVFVADMGMAGAGLATWIGQVVCSLVLITHFFKRNNNLKLVKLSKIKGPFLKMLSIGAPAFVGDICMGIVMIAYNNSIATHIINPIIRTSTLAIYGVVANVITLIQSFAYTVGQSAQPLQSKAFGANDNMRVRLINKYAVITSCVMAILICGITMLFPTQILKLFVKTEGSETIINLAPRIMRICFASFLFVPFNVYVNYFLQAILMPKLSLLLIAFRGIIAPLIFLYSITAMFGFDNIWYAMPINELLWCIVSIIIVQQTFHHIMKSHKISANNDNTQNGNDDTID